MPIPATTSAAGTAPYPWKIGLQAVNLLRSMPDPGSIAMAASKLETGQAEKTPRDALP
ncbi:hypothetical protein V8C35DRAFT_288645 [Trichoderma chlorosporum]